MSISPFVWIFAQNKPPIQYAVPYWAATAAAAIVLVWLPFSLLSSSIWLLCFSCCTLFLLELNKYRFFFFACLLRSHSERIKRRSPLLTVTPSATIPDLFHSNFVQFNAHRITLNHLTFFSSFSAIDIRFGLLRTPFSRALLSFFLLLRY